MTIKRNLRHLFCELDFAGRVENAPLMEAILFLQDLLRQGKVPRQVKPERFPVAVIPPALRRYLYHEAPPNEAEPDAPVEPRLDADRYEFLLYRLLRKELEAGNIYVKDSHEHRRFEDDLISDERWANREEILREIGAPLLLAPIEETLGNLRQQLEDKITSVNLRISKAMNEHIKVRGKGEKRRWTLIYPTSEEPVNSPFYARLPGLAVADMLWFGARETGFLKAFTHVLDRYAKQEPSPRELLAVIVGMGTNMGLGKMAEVSGLSHAALMNTARSYLRQETVHAANDAISNATARLPAFKLYNIRDAIHSSSDGQRIQTQTDTINARYSPKYFGLEKGVSSDTLVVNNVPVNAKVIGTHEHESHYVFDLLYNNTSDIRPELHSTDTHGANQVNYWILLTFGYQFAPRYRDVHKRMDKLVGFHNPSHYGDALIKPHGKVDEALIIAEWPNILRIMASLAQKDVTQATIVRKLSSYSRQNQTKKALWELDNICRTIYLLDFVDDVTLRQAVQKALNRGEAYHRFRRSVSYVNGGKFRVKTEAEQQLWNDCARLIINAIIFYNTLLLSKVYEQKRASGDIEAIAALEGISPVAWRHINLIGRFDFTTEAPFVDIDALVAHLADPAHWQKILDNDPGEELM
jgi:TnpA family transposase